VSNLEGDSFDPNLLNLPSGEGLPPLDSRGAGPTADTGGADGKKKTAKAKKVKKVKEPKLKTPRSAAAADGRPLLTRLAHANPYNVLLGIGLGALAIAIVCMILQLWGYGFAIKPTI